MAYRITLVWIVLALPTTLGCSAVVKGILEMKGDGGTGSCSVDFDCTDYEPCNGEELCDGGECVSGDPLPNGEVCDMGGPETGICEDLACLFPEGCGDGTTQPELDEQCDDGRNGDNEDGCTDDCFYSCETDEDCNDDFTCNGREVCSIPSPPDMNVRRCVPEGTIPAPMAPCTAPPPIVDGGRCLFPPSGELLCCAFDDSMNPIECCQIEEPSGDLICGPPP